MKHTHALPTMMTRYSIDFVVHMLNVSIFHVSFPALLIPLVKWYGYPNDSLLFQAAAAYGILLYLFKIFLSFHDRKQRTSGKVDWEDEVVLITGGKITSCHTNQPCDTLFINAISYLVSQEQAALDTCWPRCSPFATSLLLCSILTPSRLPVTFIFIILLSPCTIGKSISNGISNTQTLVDIDSYICDISNPEDIARVAKEIREDVGEPTILVNNAAIVNGKSILDLSIEDIKRYI